MPKPIQVLSWEMKGYLTKVVCSPELKMTKVGLLSTSCSIWSELGSEKSLLKEHTHVARRDWTFWGNNIEGGRWNKVRLFFKMHSARRGKRQVWEGKQHEWHLKRHAACRGALWYSGIQTHTNTHREAGLWNRCWASPAARIHNPHTALPSRALLLFKSPFHCSSLIHL